MGYRLAIEYRKSFGRIPDDKERKLIVELVGFVLGNQLLKIGETFYDSDLSTNAQNYRSPSEDNVLGICDTAGTPPVEIGHSIRQRGNAEALINAFLPKYMELCDSLQLSGVLSKYWLSKYAVVGINLPILSSALEALAENMLSRHPEVKQYYMEFNAYNDLIKDEVAIIDNKLGATPNKEKIINKIKGAAQRGPNEKLNMMFELIGLELGKIEKDAVKARNRMAHTSFGEISIEEAQKIIRITRAYETLFNRVILKILSHNGEYIDYYTFSRPNRKIEEPIPDDNPAS